MLQKHCGEHGRTYIDALMNVSAREISSGIGKPRLIRTSGLDVEAGNSSRHEITSGIVSSRERR